MQDNLIDTLAFLLNGTYEKYVNCHEHINVILNTKNIQSTVIVFISITFKNFISREVGKTLIPIHNYISDKSIRLFSQQEKTKNICLL